MFSVIPFAGLVRLSSYLVLGGDVVAGRGGLPDLARDGNAGGLLVAGRAQVSRQPGGSGGSLPRHRQRQAVRGASVRVDSRLKTRLDLQKSLYQLRHPSERVSTTENPLSA
jgi:hypothetical protein